MNSNDIINTLDPDKFQCDCSYCYKWLDWRKVNDWVFFFDEKLCVSCYENVMGRGSAETSRTQCVSYR